MVHEQARVKQVPEKGRVLLISHDVVGAQMAGPGIRYYQIARVLSRDFEVVLAIPEESATVSRQEPFQIVRYPRRDWAFIEPWIKAAQVLVLPSDIASDLPQLAQCGIPLVIDGYDPLLAEWLVLFQTHPQEQETLWRPRMRDLNVQYLAGDFFICASERQRDWWLGLLEANGRINPWTFREDPTLRKLVDIVPYGLPAAAPQHVRQVVKGVWSGIRAQDRVILWGGGLWPWLDPFTAIRAVGRICQRRDDVKLIFPGTAHPNPALNGISTHTTRARELAEELGLLDHAVFFGEWVPYEDWPNVLLEADVALTLHYQDTLEMRLAFRSRVLDYVWAGLPTVATCGDATGELIAEHRVGSLVAPHDVDGVAEAICHWIDTPRPRLQEEFGEARSLLTWERAVQPLVDFCQCPRIAPDKLAMGERLGNPYYVDPMIQWRERAGAYAGRRSIHVADRVVSFGKRLGWIK